MTTLYIPHGSDETISDDVKEGLRNLFISHMVQMKPIAGARDLAIMNALYPTWFR